MKLPSPLSFEWDKGNSDKNWIKHNVSNKEAEEIFLNKPLKTFRDTKHSQLEIRYFALGATNNGRYLYTTFTLRKERVRIISARNQSKKERKFYEKTN